MNKGLMYLIVADILDICSSFNFVFFNFVFYEINVIVYRFFRREIVYDSVELCLDESSVWLSDVKSLGFDLFKLI